MKVYIAGPITGNPGYREEFGKAEKDLRLQGHMVMNPAVLPDGFSYNDYLRINFAMIDVCEGVYFLRNWPDSRGARLEFDYAVLHQKALMFQPDGS